MNSSQGVDPPREPPGGSDRREKRLVERLREAIRSRHYSRRTEKAYWYWIRHFIHFHGKRHPVDMGPAEVTAFLSWLAIERNVAAATQNQALSALLLSIARFRRSASQVAPTVSNFKSSTGRRWNDCNLIPFK